MNAILPKMPSFSIPLKISRCLAKPEKKIPLIEPAYSPRGINLTEFHAYCSFIEEILHDLLPERLIEALSAGSNPDEIEKAIQQLHEQFPLLTWNNPDSAPCTLCVNLLCPTEYSTGAGRYLCDSLTRWLIPGKFFDICCVRSLNFKFSSHPDQTLFFHQILIEIANDQDLKIIQTNWEHLEKEIRLSILSVRHARQIISAKELSTDEKKAVIEENLASIIHPLPQTLSDNAFNHMHHFLLQLSAEEKIRQIQENISPYLDQKPKIFDREIFHELKHSILLFSGQFTALRDLRHVSRLISFLYLFRKTLGRMIISSPNKRHLSLKLLKCRLSSPLAKEENKIVLGISGGMNVLRENELFEERHIFDAICHCITGVRTVEGSLIIDRRSHDPIRLFYLEIEKTDGSSFTIDEIKTLKKELPRELKESVESVLNPVLMPRNEEEIIRNTLLLSQQLKFVSDLPQIIISFNGQTEEELLFNVILLRVVREKDRPLLEIFASANTELKFKELESRKMGLLRRRYPKEASVFKVLVNKKKFLRKDFSIDLFKARQALSGELNQILGGIRDYNGGILSKQQEIFQELRGMLQETSANKDFLLENFFYSISPPLRQSLIPAKSLQSLFMLMQDALEIDYQQEPYALKAQFDPDQILVMASSPHESIKEELITLMAKLQIPASELSHTYVNAYGISCVGYLYQNRDPKIRNLFYSTLLSCLQEWKARIL